MNNQDIYLKLGAVIAVTLALIWVQRSPPGSQAPGPSGKGPVLGIDIGSSYMRSAIWEDNGVSPIYNSNGRKATPTVISFTNDGRIYIGDEAQAASVYATNKTFYHVYQLLGRSWADPKVQRFKDSTYTHFTVVQKKGKPAIHVNGIGTYYPEEIVAAFLAYIKASAEDFLHMEINSTVMSVPAYFNDHQRRAVKNAGKLAGLKVNKTLNAPTAVALYHSLQVSPGGSRNKLDTVVMVIDFGASHLDVSISVRGEGIVEAVASKGTDRYSGDRINENLANYFLRKYTREYKKHPGNDVMAFAKLLKEVERVKRFLTHHEVATLDIEQFHEGQDFNSTISRDVFEDINQAIWKGIGDSIKTLLKESKYSTSSIDEVILTGGSSKIPRVKQLIRKLFLNKIALKTEDPEMLVVYGAAVQGGIIAKASSLSDVLTLDICTSTLGYKTHHGNISDVIPKYTPLPSAKTFNYTTVEHNQSSMAVHIYEGDGKGLKDFTEWGKLVIKGIPPTRKEFPIFEVTIQIDEIGLYDFYMKNRSVMYDSFVIEPAVRGLKPSEIDGLKGSVSSLVDDILRSYKRDRFIQQIELYWYRVKWELSRESLDESKRKKLSEVKEEIFSWLSSKIDAKPLTDIVKKAMDFEEEIEKLNLIK